MFKSLALRWGFESEMSMFPVWTCIQKLVLRTKQVEVKKKSKSWKIQSLFVDPPNSGILRVILLLLIYASDDPKIRLVVAANRIKEESVRVSNNCPNEYRKMVQSVWVPENGRIRESTGVDPQFCPFSTCL